MPNDFIHKKFQKKSNKLEVIDNLYEDGTFSEYYKLVTDEDSVLENDIDIYKRFFDKSESVLEIGSGTGRIFNNLFKHGYNIYGLEPSTEMSKYIDKNARNRIYPLTLQDIKYLPKNDIEVIIIPATSVSLFSLNDLEKFLKYVQKHQVSVKRIIFDFLKEDFFKGAMDAIQSYTLGLEKFYYVNFWDKSEERIIYNLVNSKKIGISVKYIYSHKSIQDLFEKLGITFNIILDSDSYTMIEGRFNEH